MIPFFFLYSSNTIQSGSMMKTMMSQKNGILASTDRNSWMRMQSVRLRELPHSASRAMTMLLMGAKKMMVIVMKGQEKQGILIECTVFSA
jgi:hypothetical protein